MIYRATLLLPLLLAFSCSGREPAPPPSVLPPERFAALYADLLKQGARTSTPAQDTLLQTRGVDSILRVHGTTRDAVIASADWYNRDVEIWKVISDSITAALERPHTVGP